MPSLSKDICVVRPGMVSSNWLQVPEDYISILKNWGELAFMFYFNSRGIVKIVSRTPELIKKLFERSKRK